MNSPELREVYNANLPKITQYYTELSQDERLYVKFKAIRASAGFAALGVERRKIVDNELRDFRLGGAELPPEEKARFKALRERLDQLSARFNDNVLDATNAFSHLVTDRAELAGVPEDVLEAAQRRPRRTESRAGSSPCTCRPICRSCSTPTTARCAS